MIKYFVETYRMETNILGILNSNKADEQLEKHLNEKSQKGWELVSMSILDVTGKDFVFKLVYKTEETKEKTKIVDEKREKLKEIINSNDMLKQLFKSNGTNESKLYELKIMLKDGKISQNDYDFVKSFLE